MKTRNLGRLSIWWAARRDRRHNLPSATAAALSPVEERIQGAVNTGVRALEAEHARRTEKPKAELREAEQRLATNDHPEFERLAGLTGRREEHVHLGRFGHHAIMGVLSIGEAAFNAVAFAITGDPLAFTLVFAASLGVALPLLAYMTGLALRQFRGRERWAWAAGASLMAMGALVAVNWARLRYMRAGGTVHDVAGDGAAVAYCVIGLTVFVAACCITYIYKDPQKGFVEAKRRLQRRRRQVTDLRGHLNECNQKLKHEVATLHECGHQAIAYYREVNRRGRKEAPRYFEDDSLPNHHVKFAEAMIERFDLTPDAAAPQLALSTPAAPAAGSPTTPATEATRVQ